MTATDALSPDHPIPSRLNLILAAGITLAYLFLFAALPMLLPSSPAWGWLTLMLGPLSFLHWALIHEAVHGMLLTDQKANHHLGRGLSIWFGASFHVLRFGHLAHHRFNREWESEYYNPAHTSQVRKTVMYYASLFGGLHLMESLLSLALWLPQRIRVTALAKAAHAQPVICPQGEHPAKRYFSRQGRLREARIDALAILLLHGAAWAAYGTFWPYLLAGLLARAITVSFFDNIYHYGTPSDNSVPAWELSAPAGLSTAMLHFNLHHTHHANARVPWRYLPDMKARQNRGYDSSLSLAACAQLCGPIPALSSALPTPVFAHRNTETLKRFTPLPA